jgi:hypothetical protein
MTLPKENEGCEVPHPDQRDERQHRGGKPDSFSSDPGDHDIDVGSQTKGQSHSCN